MISFYLIILGILLTISIILWLSLKGEKPRTKFMALWAILATFITGYAFWSYAGFASKNTYPLQVSKLANEKLPNGKLNTQNKMIIADYNAMQSDPKVAIQPEQTTHTESEPDLNQMLQMADKLEKGLKDGTKARANWALLARTREFQGQLDKAAEALINGHSAFVDSPDIQQQYLNEIPVFIERSGYGGQFLDKLKQITGSE